MYETSDCLFPSGPTFLVKIVQISLIFLPVDIKQTECLNIINRDCQSATADTM